MISNDSIGVNCSGVPAVFSAVVDQVIDIRHIVLVRSPPNILIYLKFIQILSFSFLHMFVFDDLYVYTMYIKHLNKNAVDNSNN